MMNVKHYSDTGEILTYLKNNPMWIAAFTNAEGSFTASFMTDVRAM
jgi:hypothetical protein